MSIITFRTTFCKSTSCTSIILFITIAIWIIHTYSPCYIHPICYIPFQTSIKHITTFRKLILHSIHNPIWVLHIQISTKYRFRPILYHKVSSLTIAFIHLYFLKVFTSWKKIKRYQGIKILSTTYHILIILNNILSSQIKTQLIITEFSGITNREIIAVISIIR